MKTYYIPKHFEASWVNAHSICKDFGLEMATFETLNEYNAVRELCKANSDKFTDYVHVGGMTITGNSTDDWYWLTGQKISFNLTWTDGEPSFRDKNEFCLSLVKGNFLFNDIRCSGVNKKFICQKSHSCTCNDDSINSI